MEFGRNRNYDCVKAKTKIIAQKGVKQVGKVTSADRGSLVTTCCIISASGNTTPPAMLLPRRNYKAHMLAGAVPGSIFTNPTLIELRQEIGQYDWLASPTADDVVLCSRACTFH
ncbi:hypothetical protein AVEN_207188-1 [Araneus ventricosus]|uniref:Uncharacterized protein n=1 Tax=Araneus ventricosus TaxID=182803 RepID=A0A4Y2U8P2_ARAVE|nr:hypothetical protein AVEN_31900-1 [Araneus ventricosus]GBO09220.1 hypothetical protein AVEN_207188-1 [Araneus ventricosus]